MISECARVLALAPAPPSPLVWYEADIKNLDRSSGKELEAQILGLDYLSSHDRAKNHSDTKLCKKAKQLNYLQLFDMTSS
jgi:hypothetical protein